MYSNFRSVQILVALMKQIGIRDIVLSPGGSDIPIIHSIETDDFFRCYSVVDERSAAYFAMGLAQSKDCVVACVCTSGSAVCNYLPGITESYYQNVPVLAITADKNPYYQGQLETQKIEQREIFNGVVKKAVSLPLIKSVEDEWLCNRLVNESFLELLYHGKGPVHINVPIVGRTDVYDCKELPEERLIHMTTSHTANWKSLAERLLMQKRIMVVVGENVTFSDRAIKSMDAFFKKLNVIYAVEHLSNLECEGCIYTYPVSEMRGSIVMQRLLPSLVISIGNNLSAYNLKPFLRNHYKEIKNWLVSEDGKVRDAYKCLTEIFEISVEEFFVNAVEQLTELGCDDNRHEYFNAWKQELASIQYPDFDFSNFYVAQRLAKVIPEGSYLHCAILNSTRVMQFFELARGVKTFSNVGTLGIDGCFSTFVGMAAGTEKICWLLIGDLSFFYDMNAAGIRDVGKNVRIILLNNRGGSEFYFFMGKEKIQTINDFICAEHDKRAYGWISSLGYDYYSASTKEEFEEALFHFNKESDKPMFLEVFTDMEADAEKTRKFYGSNNHDSGDGIRSAIKSVLSDKQIGKARKILNIIKEK